LFLRERNRNLKGEKRGQENNAGESSHGASAGFDLQQHLDEEDRRA